MVLLLRGGGGLLLRFKHYNRPSCVWDSETKSLRSFFVPQCAAKCSRFTCGGLGVDPCSRDPASGVRNRPQLFATVRIRPQPLATIPFATVRLRPSWAQSCRAYGKVAQTCLFRRVRSCAHGVLRGRRGTWWHSNMFHDLSKNCLCGRRNNYLSPSLGR